MIRWATLSLMFLIGCTSQSATDTFVPGVPTDHVEVAARYAPEYPDSFADASGLTEEQSAANIKRNVRIWGPGLNLQPQQGPVGSCVAVGAANAMTAKTWLDSGGRETRRVSPLFIYGVARVTEGRRRPPCGSDGAYPTFAAIGFERRGYLFEGEGVPAYTASEARRYGCSGPSADQLQIAKQRAGCQTQPIGDIKAWRNAICSGYTCTVAFDWTPGRTYVKEGRVCIALDGRSRGGHQVCSLGYDGSGREPFWFIFNSHGEAWPDGAPAPMQGEPRGGVWLDEKWARHVVSTGEVIAISRANGFVAEPLDLSIFDSVER